MSFLTYNALLNKHDIIILDKDTAYSIDAKFKQDFELIKEQKDLPGLYGKIALFAFNETKKMVSESNIFVTNEFVEDYQNAGKKILSKSLMLQKTKRSNGSADILKNIKKASNGFKDIGKKCKIVNTNVDDSELYCAINGLNNKIAYAFFDQADKTHNSINSIDMYLNLKGEDSSILTAYDYIVQLNSLTKLLMNHFENNKFLSEYIKKSQEIYQPHVVELTPASAQILGYQYIPNTKIIMFKKVDTNYFDKAIRENPRIGKNLERFLDEIKPELRTINKRINHAKKYKTHWTNVGE
ncbi:hypothetical protein K9L97_05545 [Candidatus Woesearchaeota archaeon]|nr:hypothetical protein [Candidatus Woesearchaeota archaeon]